MQTICRAVLAVVLALVASVAYGQTQVVIAGQSVMAFDHIAGDTSGYELCVDTVSAETCAPITVQPAPAGDASQVYKFTAPATIPRGDRTLFVRPVWAGGKAAASDAATFRAVVQPGKPGPVRPEANPGGN